MRSRGEIWRQRLWIWLPALLFFLANATAFSVYKLGYAGQAWPVQYLTGRTQLERELKKKAASS